MLPKPRPAVWPVVIFVLWTLFVWLNRISNALHNDALSTGSKAFSVALSVTVVALALAAGAVAVRGWSRAWNRSETIVLKIAAGWTGVLWLILVPKIVIDGRPAGFTGNLAAFKAVHSVLGLISLALAVWVWRVASTDPAREESLQSASQQ